MNSKEQSTPIDREHDALQKEFESLLKEHDLSGMTPKDIIQQHIKYLKEYNELRDTGLRLAQMVADDKKCSLKGVVEEIGYSIKDD